MIVLDTHSTKRSAEVQDAARLMRDGVERTRYHHLLPDHVHALLDAVHAVGDQAEVVTACL